MTFGNVLIQIEALAAVRGLSAARVALAGGIMHKLVFLSFFFSSRRRHTRCGRDWSSDVCSSDLIFWSVLAVSPLVTVISVKLATFRNAPVGATFFQERSFHISIGPLLAGSKSNPNRGSPGRSLITKNQPGKSLSTSGLSPFLPCTSSTERSNPKNVISGSTFASYKGVLTLFLGGSFSSDSSNLINSRCVLGSIFPSEPICHSALWA